jgi:hypothetical protein
MVFPSNKFDSYSVYCKYIDFSAVNTAKLSIKLLRRIGSTYDYESTTTDKYEGQIFIVDRNEEEF